MNISIKIETKNNIFNKDPEQSELGRNIISNSIKLIDEIGFEAFTFKKLACEIKSTEASVYRYFENKHQLLVYLTSWYWAWIDFQIDYKINNIEDPIKKIKVIIKIISESSLSDPSITHIDESLLHNIVISESSKAYLTKNVDAENDDGYFLTYKNLCKKIAGVISEINPEYKYARTLASNIIETAHEQIFFAKHLPSLTDLKVKNDNYSEVCEFLEHIVLKLLKP
jgi:AcrR family transcriptional regulator